MAAWKSRGLRGSLFEDEINRTNEKYKEQKLALIQKVPTPITPMKIDNESRHITLAYFDQKSTVDYIGVIQGIPVCFDAKECRQKTFALQNIHPHAAFSPFLGARAGRRTKELPDGRAGHDLGASAQARDPGAVSGNDKQGPV